MLSYLADKVVYCVVNCRPKWSSSASWSCCHSLKPSLPESCCFSSVSLWGQTWSGAAHHSTKPIGFSLCLELFHLNPACLAQEKSSICRTTQQFKESLLVWAPKAARWYSQPVPTTACYVPLSVPFLFFPVYLIALKRNSRTFVVMGLEFLSRAYFNTYRILDIDWAIHR